ncbi:unnamed protein product [Acanthoscelides obtectus]|uniref:Sprouty n=1 Tax=Acanthoscelides obtectus TaxID=200917 RepID=A0A9P0L9A1_ACAOB|nr:unnamed protein product [Acanthoscelides obtectus]CAK1661721.1 Protein sprouty [Acanthoscelides obtectus]
MAASPPHGNGGQPQPQPRHAYSITAHPEAPTPPPPPPPHHQQQRPPTRARPPPPVMSQHQPPTIAPLPPLRTTPPQPLSSTPIAAFTGLGQTNTAQGSVVTLAVPRPENERSTNEYVEAPFRSSGGSLHQQHHGPAGATGHLHLPPAPTRPHRLPLHSAAPLAVPAVTKQPASASFSKEPPHGSTTTGECAARPSIVCPECGRCRCESCQLPRPLPQRWCCRDSCLVSADSVIDYASCLCCVKGLFYHCGDADSGGESCADEPCGCAGERRAARWACMGALACALPCLWLYWPLQGCKRAVETCYARHSRTGCRCRRPTVLHTPQKRLLDSSPDF